MDEKRLYVDLHVVQTVPPSCINRDDTGSPKTAVYGGTTRARVSSQAWKKAMREYFSQLFHEQNIGSRTKKVIEMVAKEIRLQAPDEADAEKKAAEALKNAGIKITDKKGESDALLFMSKGQAKALAQLVVSGNTDKKAYKEAMQKEPSYDMALFGRMVASDPSLNYDAAAQVAHSISTHTIHNEYDYFTAVDDCSQEDNAGAGHLGTVEFNSFTMYRYATVNVMELYRHLGKDTAEVVEGFIKAFICSMPTGKQNTFANRTLPDAVYITVRKDQPLNLCGAFERPILSNCGYVDKSVEAMTAYAKKVYDNYADEPEKAFGIGDQLEGAAEVMSLKQLLESVKTEIQAQLDDGGEE